MSKFVFKINPEHCPDNAFDRREPAVWKADEFKVPWPKTTENSHLKLEEIKPGDKCWIWLHVERRKDKDRRSPGLVGQAVIGGVGAAEGGLLSVRFSEVSFRKAAILRGEFEQHQEQSEAVKYLLNHTTRRVAALTNDEAEDFEGFVNWFDQKKRTDMERHGLSFALPSLSRLSETKSKRDTPAEHQQTEESKSSENDRSDEKKHEANEKHANSIENRTDIGPTEKESLLKARRGQGVFKKNVKSIEPACRITGVSDIKHLRASHIKPWRLSSDFEKLDGNNGLLLSPHIDHLFDQGYISFRNTGEILVSPQLAQGILESWGVSETRSCGEFRETQFEYLSYHRDHIFRQK